MLRLLWLRLKESASICLLLLLLLPCQLGASYISSDALAQHTYMPLIALYDDDGSPQAQKLIAALLQLSNIRLQTVNTLAEGKTLVEQRQAAGLAVIMPGFDTASRNALTFYAAPGSTEAQALCEYVLAALLQIRAENNLNAVLANKNLPAAEPDKAIDPIISVVYDGPLLVEDDGLTPPRYGVALIFMLLTALHGAFALRISPRTKTLGPQAAAYGYISAAIITALIWMIFALLYWLLNGQLYGNKLDTRVLLTLWAFVIYNTGFAGLLSLSNNTATLFIPYLIINITVGGGLWELVRTPAVFKPFIPLQAGLAGINGSPRDLFILIITGVILLCAGLIKHLTYNFTNHAA